MDTIRKRAEIYGQEKRFPEASVYDEGGLLTPEEIVALKNEMADSERISQLASWIVTKMLTETYELDSESRNDPDACYASNVPQELGEKIAQSSFLGADWAIGIFELCQLPEDEWEANRISPSSFAIWNEEMKEAEQATEGEAIRIVKA